jgi:hypothetical protein
MSFEDGDELESIEALQASTLGVTYELILRRS